MKKISFLLITLGIASFVQAQSEIDALRYSLTQRPATARSFGMGSSFGALGADLSSFGTNPGGIGLYKRSGMEFSFALHNLDNTTLYNGTSANSLNSKFTLNNFGIVGSKKPANGDWVSFNFGIGYSKTNDFADDITIRGTDFNATIMDVFAAQAAGVNPETIGDDLPFTSGPAYYAYAIDPGDSLGTFYVPAASGGQIIQSKSIERSGAQSETSFSFGGNYKDILFVGGSLVFQGVRFLEKGIYREEFEEGEPLQNLSFQENIRADGTGVGLKLGFIIKPAEWVRVGAAYHTRTVISMRENYDTRVTSTLTGGTTYNEASPILVTNYNLRTPARLMANAAFVLGKAGVVAVDYEFTDFNAMNMKGTGTNSSYNYDIENETIDAIYRGTHRVSAGMEWRVAKAWYFRGGAMYQQSPFVDDVANNDPNISYTGGIGYRSDYFFIDLAAGYQTRNQIYYMYKTDETVPASIQTKALTTMISMGFRY